MWLVSIVENRYENNKVDNGQSDADWVVFVRSKDHMNVLNELLANRIRILITFTSYSIV